MTPRFVLAAVLLCLLCNLEAIPISKGDRKSADLYQGDIVGYNDKLRKGAAIKVGSINYSYWPDGQVFYIFDTTFPESGKRIVHDAMKRIESVTCVRFSESKDVNAGRIRIFQGEGCYSHIGYEKSKTRDLSLGNNCRQKSTVLHELMHVLGFWHEQSRHDRDDNVIILRDNIMEGKEHNFEKLSAENSQNFTKYDIHSILHYGNQAFSKNGEPTIVSKDDDNQQLGQVSDLSDLDIDDINAAYTCTAPVDGQWSEWSYYTSCSVSCGKGVSFRQRHCNNPEPRNGGNACLGENEEVRTCNLGVCPPIRS